MNLAMRGGLCTMCGQLPSNFVLKWSGGMWSACVHGPLAGYVKLRVAHAPGMPVTFTLPPWVSDPDIHHATCAPHEPRCRSGSLTSGFLWSRWRHSRRMRNPQFYVSGKRSIGWTLTGVTGAVEPCLVHTLSYPCDTWYVYSTLQELAVTNSSACRSRDLDDTVLVGVCESWLLTIFLSVQIMVWCLPGEKPSIESMMVGKPTHMCVIQPHWIKPCSLSYKGLYVSFFPENNALITQIRHEWKKKSFWLWFCA